VTPIASQQRSRLPVVVSEIVQSSEHSYRPEREDRPGWPVFHAIPMDQMS
jgi:hypothetical protein